MIENQQLDLAMASILYPCYSIRATVLIREKLIDYLRNESHLKIEKGV